LTIANLFCGIFAIVLSARHNFSLAGMYIVLGGIADVLDGRVARATNSGTQLGAELDSLVDAISFGFAPAMIMFFAVLNQDNWTWLFVFIYTMCACIRLARFNVEQAGRAKRYFRGLPSPAAGLTLATYYWFSQTPLYRETMIANVPWNVALLALMAVLSWLMISNVSYPAVPTVGYKSVREIIGSLVVIATILGLIFLPKEFFFPACLAYVLYGVLKTALLGLLGMRDTALLKEVAEAGNMDIAGDMDIDDEPLTTDEPVVAVASSPRLTVSAETPLPAVPQRRRRRRRPPRSGGERSERSDRPEHLERPERSDRQGRPERSENPERQDGRERPNKSRDSSPGDPPSASPPPSTPPRE
jgi:CDP-diacylglycerol--serine O-phosphatidyltransferase